MVWTKLQTGASSKVDFSCFIFPSPNGSNGSCLVDAKGSLVKPPAIVAEFCRSMIHRWWCKKWFNQTKMAKHYRLLQTIHPFFRNFNLQRSMAVHQMHLRKDLLRRSRYQMLPSLCSMKTDLLAQRNLNWPLYRLRMHRRHHRHFSFSLNFVLPGCEHLFDYFFNLPQENALVATFLVSVNGFA